MIILDNQQSYISLVVAEQPAMWEKTVQMKMN